MLFHVREDGRGLDLLWSQLRRKGPVSRRPIPKTYAQPWGTEFMIFFVQALRTSGGALAEGPEPKLPFLGRIRGTKIFPPRGGGIGNWRYFRSRFSYPLHPNLMTLDPCMGVTPCPSWEAPCVANIIFGCGCERGFHSSTFNFTLHFSAHSLAFWENVLCYRVMDHGAPPPLGSPVAVIVILG